MFRLQYEGSHIHASFSGIARIFDHVTEGPDVGLVMEYLPGGDLRRRILGKVDPFQLAVR